MMNSSASMTQFEKRAAFSVASIHAIRMLGLFMILPIFSLYAAQLQDATPTLIGLAIGIYGLTQAFLQIPFGTLSDYLGRKPIITCGLLIFTLGSIIAAMSHNIYGVILGRALQGSGAVGSATTALLADLTRDEHRTKAMALIGLTIGVAFAAAIIIGPMINVLLNFSGIFWLSALLGLFAILLLFIWVPDAKQPRFSHTIDITFTKFLSTITNINLARLDFGVLASHAMLSGNFVVLPILLANNFNIESNNQWLIYLPVLVLSFLIMLPMIFIAEKKRQMKNLLWTAISMLILAELALALTNKSIVLFSLSLLIFFTAFCFLEACLPSLISKQAPFANKGTALGVYSTAQFLGIFIGGVAGGWLYGHHHSNSVFIFCALLGGLWLLTCIGMSQPLYLKTQILHMDSINKDLVPQMIEKFLNVKGVHDVMINPEEGTVYLKVDQANFNKEHVQALNPLHN